MPLLPQMQKSGAFALIIAFAHTSAALFLICLFFRLLTDIPPIPQDTLSHQRRTWRRSGSAKTVALHVICVVESSRVPTEIACGQLLDKCVLK
jgi:hypothetical protein